MKDDNFFDSCKEALDDLKTCAKVLSQSEVNANGDVQYAQDVVIGHMQAILAAYSIRITGVSVSADAEEGSNIAITYEYKWVPTDGSRAIPRWDTGVVVTYSTDTSGLGRAYVRIFTIVAAARETIRKMPKQSVDL